MTNSFIFVQFQVNDFYDEIDLTDTKDISLVRNQKALQDLTVGLDHTEEEFPIKRARLDINYSIGPAGAFASLNGSQQSRRKMTLVNRIV